jgi:hypothetical protein
MCPKKETYASTTIECLFCGIRTPIAQRESFEISEDFYGLRRFRVVEREKESSRDTWTYLGPNCYKVS